MSLWYLDSKLVIDEPKFGLISTKVENILKSASEGNNFCV